LNTLWLLVVVAVETTLLVAVVLVVCYKPLVLLWLPVLL
jgi:hypothetical protein